MNTETTPTATPPSLYDHVRELMARHPRFGNDRVAIQNAARQLDPELLDILLNDDTARRYFFQKVGEVFVFDRAALHRFVYSRQFLPNSYTAYRNKIGLATEQGFISGDKRIVLDYPYKDCVLSGNQTKEEGAAKELFLNRFLAPEQIDLLLTPKAFSNFKTYDAAGVRDTTKFGLSDNYLIKGNNLIALSSIREVFRNKIKLIYIDPPYNTGNDGFNYNDNYSHSSWLTFMKNRLEIARELLREDGIIFISCDDRENAYLKVLMDEIFGRDKFITNLIWRKKAGGANDSQDIAVEHEYILAYRKQENGIFKIPLDERTLKSYKFRDDEYELRGPYKLKNLDDASLSDSPGLHYEIVCPDGSVLSGENHQWKCNLATFLDRLAADRIVFKKVKGDWRVFYKIYLNEQRGELRYDDRGNVIARGRNLSSILYDVALNKDGSRDIKKHFGGRKPFSYPKPVELLKTLIRVATGPEDTVLDFFAGSGTTAEAVLALNADTGSRRNFIAIEQMDYIEDITLRRIENSLRLYHSNSLLHYFELHKINRSVIDRINAAANSEVLIAIVKDLKRSAFVDHRFSEALDRISPDDPFDLIKLALLEILDPNFLYLPLSEARDTDFAYSEENLRLTQEFYLLD